MGVNHGSAVSLRIKRQAKIEAKSLDLKRYNNFLLRKRDCLEPRSYQRGMTGKEAEANKRPPCHHTARHSRSGRDTALELNFSSSL
jgi:hypothetical protein